MPGEQRLPLGYKRSGNQPRVRAVQHGARAYAQSQGLRYSSRGMSQVQAAPQTQFAIQEAYRRAQASPEDEHVRNSYAAFRGETDKQYAHMVRPRSEGGMGLRHEVTEHDPYSSPGEMTADVRRGRIRTLATTSTDSTAQGHAFLTNEENDRFRAVHDVFGHAGTGRGFTRHGEEAAWKGHVQMYSPEARPAMTSETRGQNSMLNYAPGQKGFVDQSKLVGLPKWAEQKHGMPTMQPRQFAPQGEQGKMF